MRDPTRAKHFWNVLLQRAASDCADAIELYVRGQNPHCKQTTADPSEVANLFRDEYAKIGTDSLPPGHSFDIAAHARQDAALAAILCCSWVLGGLVHLREAAQDLSFRVILFRVAPVGRRNSSIRHRRAVVWPCFAWS